MTDSQQAPAARAPQLPPDDTTRIRSAAAEALTWGFRVSAALLALGLLVTLIQGDDISSEATSYGDLIPDLLDGEGSAIISLGILSMMATPVASVLVVSLGFFKIADRRFGRVSLFVLVVLAVSVVASFLR